MGSKTVRILMFPSDVSDKTPQIIRAIMEECVCVCGGGGDCGLLLFCCVYLIQDFIKYKQKKHTSGAVCTRRYLSVKSRTQKSVSVLGAANTNKTLFPLKEIS